MNHTTIQRLAVVVACTALGVATTACGDDDATASSSQPTTAPPATQSTTPATTSAPTAATVPSQPEPDDIGDRGRSELLHRRR